MIKLQYGKWILFLLISVIIVGCSNVETEKQNYTDTGTIIHEAEMNDEVPNGEGVTYDNQNYQNEYYDACSQYEDPEDSVECYRYKVMIDDMVEKLFLLEDDDYYDGGEYNSDSRNHQVSPHSVEGYQRGDGTEVQGYWRGGDSGYSRSNPDGNPNNNIGK